MKIRNVIDKRLRRFIQNDDATGLQPAIVPKVRRMISFLQDMEREDELRTVPIWKAHQLTGDRKGTWSLFVTRNWRITFRINRAEIEIIDLDFEDYH
ncbi:MAG: type II toxin-antitoxin system RelE/ParE family toxin [Alphaproteobacteria bacterium]